MSTRARPASNSSESRREAAPGGDVDRSGARRVLGLSTVGFTLMFAAWLMFGILGKPISTEFGLSEVQLSWIIAAAVLNGSLWRLPAGMITDRGDDVPAPRLRSPRLSRLSG